MSWRWKLTIPLLEDRIEEKDKGSEADSLGKEDPEVPYSPESNRRSLNGLINLSYHGLDKWVVRVFKGSKVLGDHSASLFSLAFHDHVSW